jgi:D-alanyl-D-alanine carboxypeptidase
MRFFRTPTIQDAAEHFDRYFLKLERKGNPKPLQVRIFSRKLGLDYSFPSNSTNRPYHTASIGKVFTAALVYMLAERGLLKVQDLVASHLHPAMLDRLFVYQNTDYAQQVTIEHLIGHTSGVADYFEGRTTRGKSLMDEVLLNPQFHWTPQTLLDFTRNQQTAVGIPGKVFNYSDAGYILLGLIIEKGTGKSFAQNLADEIFLPLEMRDSYMMFYGEPRNTPKPEIEKIWFNGVEVSRFESLSCDWSGGGIITTTADLLKFDQALRSGRLVGSETLAAMDTCPNKFRQGIYYGMGMMEIRFKEFFFLLGHLPKIKGHIGILATHMFYDPAQDAHILMNFGDNTRMVESFQALIEIENTLYRVRR